jgi:8-oxo-dGTP diphosphatase
MGLLDVTAAIIRKNGRFLITERGEGKHAGKWDFPGGKLHAGETPEECIVRELKEELDIEAFGARYLFDATTSAIRLMVFEIERFEREIKHFGVKDHRFLSLDEIERLPLLEADVLVIKRLRETEKAPRPGR